MAALVKIVTEEFDVETSVARADIESFTDDLRVRNFLE